MDRPIVAVVMAGGTGTRLYPASRSDRPKQFLAFDGDRSLLSRTVERLDFADEVLVSTRPAFAEEIPEHAPDAEVLVEPAGKDTGPAMLYATHQVGRRFEDPVVLCLPSDHWIEGDFASVATRAVEVATETDGLVTIGIDPDGPETGYGYVKPGEEREGYATVAEFREKPDRETAERYVEAGYYWNAGMFAWTPAALEQQARDTPLEPLLSRLPDDPAGGFGAVEPVSIDYAVMEQTGEAYVVPADFAWDDLGAWDAIERVFGGELADSLKLDAAGNVLAGEDVHVTAIGVSDLVIAAYDDRVLVVPKDDAQRVREAVRELREDELF